MYQMIVTVSVFACSACMDIKYRMINKKLVVGYFLAAVGGHLVMRDRGAAEMVMSLIPGGICMLFSWITRQGLGLGDSLLILICGISLGLSKCAAITVFAFFWAGIWALIQFGSGRVQRKKEIPFVPFLLVGAVVHWISGG